ncbi:MAG: YggS family pyridoxal phosphate-dependent enzyme [Acidobacteriota bacterium]
MVGAEGVGIERAGTDGVDAEGVDTDSAADRLRRIHQRIAEACERSGRTPHQVTLVGASKRQSAERLRAVRDAGLRVFGENQVGEGEAHRDLLTPSAAGEALEWHLIGPLQSNKAKRAAQLFEVFHAVDRVKIGRVLDRHLSEANRRAIAFLEINLGNEESKHGFAPAAVAEAARSLADLEHLDIRGLMAIPPPEGSEDRARQWFQQLVRLRDDLDRRPEWAGRLRHLSMGMSGDFELAVEEGATHIRVGTALFGPRKS